MVSTKKKFSQIFTVFFLIVLLVNLPISASYFIGESSLDLNKDVNKNKNSFFKKSLKLLADFFYGGIGFISAEDVDSVGGCCVVVGDGSFCEMTSDRESCQGVWKEGQLCDENIEGCEEGWCYDEDFGTCAKMPQAGCERPSEFFSLFASECKQGCCIVNDNFDWITEKQCEVWASEEDFSKREAWMPEINNDVSCSLMVKGYVKGACVYSDGGCEYLRADSCSGNFIGENELCSGEKAKDAGSYCKSHEDRENYEGTCFEQLENAAYYTDSCGQPDGIIDGGCDNDEMCERGECVSTSCVFVDPFTNFEITYQNGEEWCVFDSWIGVRSFVDSSQKNFEISVDPPGSTHWKASCIRGEIDINPCDESKGARGSVCVERTLEEGEDKFTLATCETNMDTWCISQNAGYSSNVQERIKDEDLEITDDDKAEDIEEKMEDINKILESERRNLKELCGINPQCNFMDIGFQDYSENGEILQNDDFNFGFPACVGSYPSGDKFCILGSRTCSVTFAKNAAGRYKCIHNCECLEEEFVKEMNDFCVSLGDCGSYVNYNGEFSSTAQIDLDPAYLDRRPKQGGGGEDHLTDISDREKGNKSRVIFKGYDEGISNMLEAVLNARYSSSMVPSEKQEVGSIFDDFGDENSNSLLREIFGQDYSIISGGEFTYWLSGAAGVFTSLALTFGWFASSATQMTITATAITKSIGFVSFGVYALPAVGALLGAALGNAIAGWTGQGGGGQISYIISFAVIGAISGYGAAVAFTSVSWTFGPAAWIILAVAAAMAIYTFFTGWGETTTVDVEFTCNNWQAPIGGENCEYCNEYDLDYPCNEYKCNSLGQACEFIGGNDNPICIANINDGEPPILSIGEVQEGYSLPDFSNRETTLEENGGCVEEQSDFWFILSAEDKKIQCKYSFEKSGFYEEMENNYLSGADFLGQHRAEIEIPNLFELNLSGGEEAKLYIRCQDDWGNFNVGDGYVIDMCVSELADESKPVILAFEPEDEKVYDYNPGELSVDFYVNERVDQCRWSNVSREIDLMENSIQCGSSETSRWIDGEFVQGYSCQTRFTDLKKGLNKFYIKCEDPSGNIGDYIYQLDVSRDITEDQFVDTYGLEIISFSPSLGEVFNTSENPARVQIEIETSGGVDNGKSTCEYSFTEGSSSMSLFDYTGDITTHKNTFDYLVSSGDYHIYVSCQDPDRVSNDTIELNFTLNIDQDAPQMIDNFTQGDYLTIVTDEYAKCFYSPLFEDFDIEEEGEPFNDVSYTLEHVTEFNPTMTYFIKCRDVLGNEGLSGTIGDSEPTQPEITKIYSEGSSLLFNTNVLSKCYASYSTCDFDVEEAPLEIDSGFTREHSTDLNSATTYHIKCEDKWGTLGRCEKIQPNNLVY